MPGRRRDSSANFSGTIPVARNSTILHHMDKSLQNKDQNRERHVGSCSIPLPKSTQFTNVDYTEKIDTKLAKTEKNRLRLVMRNNEKQPAEEDDQVSFIAPANDKQKSSLLFTRDTQYNGRPTNRTIPRYQPNKYSDATRTLLDRKVIIIIIIIPFRV